MNKLFFIFSIVFGLSAVAAPTKPPADWNKLAQASVLLNAASVATQTSPLFCSIEPDEAKILREKLDKKIDTTMKSWTALHKHAASYADPSWPVSCRESCSCGLDASLLERVGLAHLGTQDRWIFRRVSTLALEQTPSATNECASRQSWFCDSSMLKQLRRSK